MSEDFFKCLKFYLVTAGIAKARCEIFKKNVAKFGGSCLQELDCKVVSHVIINDDMEEERLLRILKVENIPEGLKIVKAGWLGQCVREKVLISTTPYELELENTKKRPRYNSSEDEDSEERISKKRRVDLDVINSIQHDSDSDYHGSDTEPQQAAQPLTQQGAQDSVQPVTQLAIGKKVVPGHWVCAHASGSKRNNFNEHITDKLQALAKTYENTNDRWRALGYNKAIGALKRLPHEVQSWEEARSLPGVGNRLADKIWEIASSGELRKLTELTSSDEVKALDLFTGVWGAGPHTARRWVQQGLRSLDDLKSKATLTKHQQIGLLYYDELLDRMPREEAGEIEATVRTAAEQIQPGVTVMACGSYRRGKATCGDVDVLVTHSDGKSHREVFRKLLDHLHETGFLTDDLVVSEEGGTQQKYLGVCQLPGGKHRRLDIIVVPFSEFACASLYFTGSAHFNRSMRHLASKMAMSLSEHALCASVLRSKTGEKMSKGEPLLTPTEESVFTHLGLVYRPPDQRDH